METLSPALISSNLKSVHTPETSFASIHLDSTLERNISSSSVSPLCASGDENNFPTERSSVLKDVVAYVEVRTNSDNRSRAVGKELEALGATVVQKLTNEVTHVIFKDGKKSTRERAKKKGLYLVTVLWVDSCKRRQELVPEALFPVAAEDKTPTLFGRFRKAKSMQPTDFDEDVANSAEKGEKRRKRVALANKWKIAEEHTPDIAKYNTPASKPDIAKYNTTGSKPDIAKYNTSGSKPDIAKYNTPGSKPDIVKYNTTGSKPDIVKYNTTGSKPDIVKYNTTGSKPDIVKYNTPGSKPPVLAAETQPQSLCLSDDDAPNVTIPDTPPSMRARKEACEDREKKSRRDSGSFVDVPSEDDSPVCSGVRTTPLQRRLFDNIQKHHSPEGVTDAVKNLNEFFKLGPTARKRKLMTMKELSPAAVLIAPTKASGQTKSLLDGGDKKKGQKRKGASLEDLGATLESPINKRRKTKKSETKNEGTVEDDTTLGENHTHANKISDTQRYEDIASTDGTDCAHASWSDAGKNLKAKTRRKSCGSVLSIAADPQTAVGRHEEDKQNKPKTIRRRSCIGKVDAPSGSLKTNLLSDSNSESQVRSSRRKSTLPVSSAQMYTGSEPKARILKQSNSRRKSCGGILFTSSDPQDDGNESTETKNLKSVRRKSGAGNLAKSKANLDNDIETPVEISTKKNARAISGSDISDKAISIQSEEMDTNGCKQDTTSCLKEDSAQGNQTDSISESFSIRAKNRRSIDDFASNRKLSQSMRKAVKSTSMNSSDSDDSSKTDTSKTYGKKNQRKKKVAFSDKDSSPKPKRSLVTTSLHFSEQEIVHAVVKNLGGFHMLNDVDDSTTHIVCGGSRRTLNILYGIARGCWVLSLEWVLKSLEAGRWLDEEPFEAHDYFPAAQFSRLERYAAGPSYKQSIFADVGEIYVSENTFPPQQHLISLIHLCGGTKTTCPRKATVCIGPARRMEATLVSEQWVLDSITSHMQLPLSDYAERKQSRSTSPAF